MHIIKPRFEPEELRQYRSLCSRLDLSSKDVNHYANLEKGFKGERLFDTYLSYLSDDWLILNDLLLEYNGSIFQIDSLLISHKTIYLIEIKNHDGDYFIQSDKWYTLAGTDVNNPLQQLNRSESLLRKLLKNLGYPFAVEGYVVFVNPEFYLYQAPMNLPIIFPTQINRFMNNLNIKSQKLQDKHYKLAKQLASLHIHKYPYKHIPEYTYDELKKGISCASCCSLHTVLQGDNIVCKQCGSKEEISTAILRSVKEFQLLFPDRKITTNGIFEWCNGIKSKKSIWRILSKNFTRIGSSIASYYKDTSK